MKKLVVAGLAAILLIVVAAAAAHAGSSGPLYLEEITIESDFHHLGDNGACTICVVPDPEGIAWETQILLTTKQLRKIRSAHLEFYLLGSSAQFDSVAVNGRSFALPLSDGINKFRLPHVDKTLVSIPVGLLQAGENTIGFASNSFGSGAPPTNTHDDFEFGDVVLLLSK